MFPLSSFSDPSFSRWPHRIAVITACATVPLLFIGGLVTSKGAGLAVPDWPTSFGYNMFLYPWSKMVGNIFYEHSHRLFASAVGFLTIALAVTFWFKERRNWVRWLAIAALGLVITQGVIGGLRVVLLENTLAIVHAMLAQAFALTVSLAIFTSAGWREPLAEELIADGGPLTRLCAITTGLLYIQAIFGAVLRHTGGQFEAHLLLAAIISVHVILVVARVHKTAGKESKLLLPARFLGTLLFLQIALGISSYLTKLTSVVSAGPLLIVLLTTTHLLVGALMLVTSLFATLKSFQVSSGPSRLAGRNVLQEQFSL